MKVLLGIVFLLVAGSVQALDSCMTGSWYSTDRIGEGIQLEILEDKEIIYFFTYRNQKQVWYLSIDGVVYTTRKRNEDPFEVDTFKIGTSLIEVHDNDNLTFTYHLDLDIDRSAAIPWCLSQCYGVHSYIRLTQPLNCQ